MAKTCVYCGIRIGNSNRAREHVIPSWLQKHLGIEKETIHLGHIPILSNTPKTERAHPADQFLLGNVCKLCNNGWMSRMETRNQATIKSLIAGNFNILDQIDESDKLALARWIVKTALCYNNVADYPYKVPKSHFKHVYERKNDLPAELIVLCKRNPYYADWFLAHDPKWMPIVYRPEVDRGRMESAKEIRNLIHNSYKIILQFGHAMFIVVYCKGGHSDFRFILQPDQQTILWTHNTDTLQYFEHPIPIRDGAWESPRINYLMHWIAHIGLCNIPDEPPHSIDLRGTTMVTVRMQPTEAETDDQLFWFEYKA